MSSSRLPHLGVTAALVSALLIGACSDQEIDNASSVESSTSTIASTPTNSSEAASRSTDGVLRLGLLVPLSDTRATFGPALIPLAESAIRLMSSLGGFDDQAVELIVRDEGTTPAAARTAGESLVREEGVDAVIGPFSSVNALSVVPSLISSGVGVCSPAVPSLALDQLEDNGLLIRTGSQDKGIISSMVDLAVQSGTEKVSIGYPDDPYGRSLARLLRADLSSRELTIASVSPYSPTDPDYADLVVALIGDDAPVELVITTPTVGPGILNVLAGLSRDSVIITNDVVIESELSNLSGQPDDTRPRVFGYAPNVELGNDELLTIIKLGDKRFPDSVTRLPPYSLNTVDCFALIWLAALVAESDDPQVFKAELLRISNDGSPCLWIPDCKFSVDEGLNVDYDGIGDLDLDEGGTPVGRDPLLFEYNADGALQRVQGVADVGLAG